MSAKRTSSSMIRTLALTGISAARRQGLVQAWRRLPYEEAPIALRSMHGVMLGHHRSQFLALAWVQHIGRIGHGPNENLARLIYVVHACGAELLEGGPVDGWRRQQAVDLAVSGGQSLVHRTHGGHGVLHAGVDPGLLVR